MDENLSKLLRDYEIALLHSEIEESKSAIRWMMFGAIWSACFFAYFLWQYLQPDGATWHLVIMLLHLALAIFNGRMVTKFQKHRAEAEDRLKELSV